MLTNVILIWVPLLKYLRLYDVHEKNHSIIKIVRILYLHLYLFRLLTQTLGVWITPENNH